MTTRPLRPCLGCQILTRSSTGRCGVCETKLQKDRNQARKALYAGPYIAHRRKALAGATLCPRCGIDLIRSRTARNGATWDHEHGQVECRSCNSSHRRNPA